MPPDRQTGYGEQLLSDEDVPVPIHGDINGDVELPVPDAQAAPLGHEGARVVELLDAVVDPVGDVDVPAPVGRYAVGELELPVPAAQAAPLRQEGPVVVELLDAVV